MLHALSCCGDRGTIPRNGEEELGTDVPQLRAQSAPSVSISANIGATFLTDDLLVRPSPIDRARTVPKWFGRLSCSSI